MTNGRQASPAASVCDRKPRRQGSRLPRRTAKGGRHFQQRLQGRQLRRGRTPHPAPARAPTSLQKQSRRASLLQKRRTAAGEVSECAASRTSACSSSPVQAHALGHNGHRTANDCHGSTLQMPCTPHQRVDLATLSTGKAVGHRILLRGTDKGLQVVASCGTGASVVHMCCAMTMVLATHPRTPGAPPLAPAAGCRCAGLCGTR